SQCRQDLKELLSLTQYKKAFEENNSDICSYCSKSEWKVSNLLHNEQHHLNPVEAKDISTDISTPNYKRGIIGPETQEQYHKRIQLFGKKQILRLAPQLYP
ncbi:4154_t:CDS:2, partial [Dentiscutata erythropus]